MPSNRESPVLFPLPTESTPRELAALASPVVSLFVPVTAAVPQVSQNSIRHARTVASALERMRALDFQDEEIACARRALANFAHSTDSPAHRVGCRAAFWSRSTDRVATFGLPKKLDVEECAVVASQARLRPVLLASQRPDRFRILVLSTNRVALYEGTSRMAGLQTIDALPLDLVDALGAEIDGPHLQFHGAGGPSEGARPIYHGQGGAARGREIDLEKFHRKIARALERAIGEDPVPLLLAVDSKHHSLLSRALRRDVGLMKKALTGNFDHLEPGRLRELAWPMISEENSVDAAGELSELDASNARVLRRLSEITRHAVMGRVRRLFIPERARIPGRIDPDRGMASEAWGDDELLDDLAATVLRQAGTVRVLEGATYSAEANSLAAEIR